MIQHAGFVNPDAGFVNPDAGFVNPDSNYIKLKQTINNVSLNDILLESKSLLNRLKNN